MFRKNQKRDGYKGRLQIHLPKFKIEDKVDVKSTLEGMGMGQLFEKADFSNMVDSSHQPTAAILRELVIKKITQKSVLAVDEQGTEAATVTVQVMKAECCVHDDAPQKTINFNRPFLSVLTYKQAPILMGAIRAPNEKSRSHLAQTQENLIKV
ncbi:MAG: hypothetical protein JSR46_06020 [Verrucomicrobia bacterium]|nr:hypothetical protein [Verrucomicrobiota bacterium]